MHQLQSYENTNKKIITNSKAFGAPQKQQKLNFVLIPMGTKGTIICQETTEDNITYYNVRFILDNKKIFAKLASTMFKFIEE